MPPTTLYWHDYETYGINPRHDYPAQFAGLRTDLDLNVVGEPTVIHCQPPRDRLPAPEACLLTGITPQRTQQCGLIEAEFAAAVHADLSQPGTCGVGYNTMRFDDEVTRHCLYRNFFDPYEREWRNGNSRWDIIDMVRLTAALRPDGIVWPTGQDGQPSFKLELLAHANGLAHTHAHDALSDVHATIALARLVRERQPKLYDYVWRNRGKHEAAALVQLGHFAPVLHVSEKYPAERGCIALVVALARHPVNAQEIIVCDLNADPDSWLDLSAEDIRTHLFTRTADFPDGVRRIPLKTVHLNRCPILVPPNTLRPQDADRLGIDRIACERNLNRLQTATGLAAKLTAVFTRPAVEHPETDPDRMLYSGGFFSESDRASMAKIRAMNPQQLATAASALAGSRLPEMLFRYRARNWPDSLNAEEQARWQAFRQSRLTEKTHSEALTLAEFEASLKTLEATANGESLALIAALREWAGQLSQTAAPAAKTHT